MFDQATRLKLRFETPRGLISVEDLWDLPLTGATSLDAIAIKLHKQLRDTAVETSFVNPAEAKDKTLQLRFDIVKHILDVRIKERDEAALTREKKAKKQQLLEILARKQTSELEGKTTEELTTMINAL